ncbi:MULTISPECIES: RNase E specificity factor CsrD [unclassified Brenneria]|uniref:RNase E specificity factor CsrD n=1 Tax=unclassified Brenneria TaxID=2634434 RepID=UPI0015563478|nr:RNase E specificity factor CsrD [Brenneria sp. hezel4-2-4]MEE3651472.1 RNase E specificity factor CsrD [Brenneria sp. HEZEL_4_2_4]NPD01428.1 RNase E specificity factor CsrD [Brenneria sp. hezel4-2-4]
MGLTTRLSMLMTLLTALAVCLMLFSSIFSLFYYSHQRTTQQLREVAVSIDQALLVQSPESIRFWLPVMMKTAGVVALEIRDTESALYSVRLPEADDNRACVYRDAQLPLMHHLEMAVTATYIDPLFGAPRVLISVLAAIGLMVLVLYLSVLWLRRQTAGQEELEARAKRILHGERESVMHGSAREWPVNASGAIDQLLADLVEAREERSRVDTLIRAFAAQDAETGLSNRLFFDNQLTTQLEDIEDVGTHGIVMMIRLPDFETLQETHGYGGEIQEYSFTLVNLLSTFVMRYPSALLARYFNSDFTVLLPHCTLKEADNIAAQLVKAIDILPVTPLIDREDILHIGICAYRSGQSSEQVMESVEDATRNAVLQGGNGWCVFDRQVPEKGRGSVKWRTLLEQTLARGGPRLYQKPAVTREGVVHHCEMMSRIYDGTQELLAAEYMPLVQQLGLTASYDRQLISRIIALSVSWPDETLAMPVSVDSLLQKTFIRWLKETLLQCPKKQRQRILFELAEADVCQYIGRLRPVLNLVLGLGCRLAVTQAGLTLVSTTYIKSLQVEIIKLHPGLVRSLERRPENQLFVQSLTEACKGTQTKVFAAGVRTKAEWRTLLDKGVYGGQGDFFASSVPVSDELKKYSPHCRV